jgi:hypothetical protein
MIVVDPSEGSGRGPRQLDVFSAAYPRVEFIRERFPPSRAIAEVDAVYSISVVEHVPVAAVGELIATADGALRPGGLSVHAIDHVLAGWGAQEYRERLDEIARSAGVAEARVAQVLARLERDPEAYFVSAEAHERWRGDLAYDDYPMRKVASVSLATRRS